MSEPRKNHLSIDGGQVKDDDHVASYKPIPESDTVPEFRTSKSSLAKSKEKVSSDGAEEKLLAKEDEAKIVTRVDMADAKYVVGDHRNGDAKIELDANKRQFSGLTKEELMKYADDPFWVRLRWFMFIMFWALWLCMLAGAIAIIVKAPKCAPPPPRTWFEKGPLVDMSSVEDYRQVEEELPLLQAGSVAGVFAATCRDAYDVLDDPSCLDDFRAFVAKAKSFGVKVIVDLTANFVSKTHYWFQQSENRSSVYSDYFTWKPSTEYDENNPGAEPKPPNNWVSTLNAPAWTWSEKRREFYLHQFGEDQPDLNMANPDVVKQFDAVLNKWMQAGADGVRLHHARLLLVNTSIPNEKPATSARATGADHGQYDFWTHDHTVDQPGLGDLLAHWSHLVDSSAIVNPGAGETVFTLAEDGSRPEVVFTSLRPASLAPLRALDAEHVAQRLQSRLAVWPALQLIGESAADQELASFAMLLPAAPVLDVQQLDTDNTTSTEETLGHLVSIRSDASVEHGQYHVTAVPSDSPADKLLACARWKKGHTGFVGVYNPAGGERRGNLTRLAAAAALPADLALHHASRHVKEIANYTINQPVSSDDVLVPAKSTVILSYVPKKAVDN